MNARAEHAPAAAPLVERWYEAIGFNDPGAEYDTDTGKYEPDHSLSSAELAERYGRVDADSPEGTRIREAEHAEAQAEADAWASVPDSELGDGAFWGYCRSMWMYSDGWDPQPGTAEAEAYTRIAADYRADLERTLAAREAEAG